MSREYKSFFKTVGGNEGGRCNWPTRLDAYGCGCVHNCAYCYGAALLDFRKLWDPESVRVADPGKIERKLDRLDCRGMVLRFGGMTDCFSETERAHQVARQTVRMFQERGGIALIVTKGLVVRDCWGEFRPEQTRLQVSVPILCERRSKLLEPGAPTPADRLGLIRDAEAAGFRTTLRLSPYYDGWADGDELTAAVERCRPSCILLEFLRLPTRVLDLPGVAEKEFTLRRAGARHLPKAIKADCALAIAAIARANGCYFSVCEDIEEHAEYLSSVCTDWFDCCHLGVPCPKVRENAFRIFTPNGGTVLDLSGDG